VARDRALVDGPRHVAIIMDGNGRWAKQRGLPRTFGHRSGVNALKRTVQAAPELGVEVLTVFGFSTENWGRPATEVAELMGLLRAYVETDWRGWSGRACASGCSGPPHRALGGHPGDHPPGRASDRPQQSVPNAGGVTTYGGRLTSSMRRVASPSGRSRTASWTGGRQRSAARRNALHRRWAAPRSGGADPAGKHRVSNFLLWEAAYAEYRVSQDVLWPDYGAEHLQAAIDVYRRRDRRFGALAAGDVLAAG
jgi:undecaprenyl diphosphate synthase